jgi:epoxyqueuosine reductase
VAPFTVDARRCLTTWNVESPLAPDGEAFAGSGWALGCDVCQEVCPWNRFAQPATESRYAPRHTHLSPEAAPEDVDGTPLARPGRENLVALARRALAPPAAGLRISASKQTPE